MTREKSEAAQCRKDNERVVKVARAVLHCVRIGKEQPADDIAAARLVLTRLDKGNRMDDPHTIEESDACCVDVVDDAAEYGMAIDAEA